MTHISEMPRIMPPDFPIKVLASYSKNCSIERNASRPLDPIIVCTEHWLEDDEREKFEQSVAYHLGPSNVEYQLTEPKNFLRPRLYMRNLDGHLDPDDDYCRLRIIYPNGTAEFATGEIDFFEEEPTTWFSITPCWNKKYIGAAGQLSGSPYKTLERMKAFDLKYGFKEPIFLGEI